MIIATAMRMRTWHQWHTRCTQRGSLVIVARNSDDATLCTHFEQTCGQQKNLRTSFSHGRFKPSSGQGTKNELLWLKIHALHLCHEILRVGEFGQEQLLRSNNSEHAPPNISKGPIDLKTWIVSPSTPSRSGRAVAVQGKLPLARVLAGLGDIS